MDKNTLSYLDAFAIGWNRARCGDDLESTEALQAKNAAYLIQYGADPGDGMVDGWKARMALQKD